MRKALLLVGIFALLVLVGSATAAENGNGTSTTPGDPFASCTLGGDIFGAVVFPSTEPEVWLAANPAKPANLIGAIQQDRWSDGGAKGLVAPYSLDGGNSWNEVALPFSECAAAYYRGKVLHYDRASDPWVDIGPDGTAYQVSISFNGNDNAGAIGAVTSTDGGQSWKNLKTIISESASDPTLPFNDKESVTADPVVAGRAYAVWERLKNIACPPGVTPSGGAHPEERPASSRVVGIAAAALNCFDGPTLLSFTKDGGRSWSKPRIIVPTPANEQTIGNVIVVDPRSHTLYDFYMYIDAHDVFTVENVASHDGGLTWSSRQLVSQSLTVGVTDPDTGALIRTGDIIPEPAIDPRTGTLYVVWQDPRFNGGTQDQVVISQSSFGGIAGTWTAPVLVNDAKDTAAFTPAIRVVDGKPAVSYYRFARRDRGPKSLPVDLMFRLGGGRAVQVGGPFNMLAAPYAFGYFTGDYQGMAVSPLGVTLFSTLTNCLDNSCAAVAGFDADGNPIPSNAPNPTDVYAFTDQQQEGQHR